MQKPDGRTDISNSPSTDGAANNDAGEERTKAQPSADSSAEFPALIAAEAQWLGNEFNALRAEFIQRFQTENLLILGALTFLGSVMTVAFKASGEVNSQLLLVLPIIMPLVGTFYINQRLSNSTIGIYIRDVLASRLSKIFHSDVLAWEAYVRKNTSTVKELTLFLFILTVFAGPGSFILIYTRATSSLISLFAGFAWWTGTVLTTIWVALWGFLYRGWFGKKR